MSLLKNIAGLFMPHFESRRSAGNGLMAVNAELVHDVDGDDSATIYLDGGGATLNASYVIEVSPDGVNYMPALMFPYTPGCAGGTIPVAAQPAIVEAVNAVGIRRTMCVATNQMRKVRVRLSAWTAGAADVLITSDATMPLSAYVRDQKAATLAVTVTGASGAIATCTLPAVAGLRHYLDMVQVVRSATAVLTPAATPVLVTTTNLPGNPILSFGADAAAQGVDKEQTLDYGASGLAASAIGVATTIVCPATTGVIWRVNASYRLGL